jgi:uncharacterized membrane protein YbhN (UPF0104 family)
LSSHRWGGAALKLVVSAVLIALVCRNIGKGAITGRFVGQSAVWLVAAAAVTVSQIVLVGCRWQQLLDGLGAGVSAGRVMLVTYIGSFFNSWLLGTTGGDVARAMLIPTHSVGRAGIVHSVLFDRLSTLAGLGLIMLPLVAFDLGPFAHSLPLLLSLAVVPVPLIGMAVLAWTARRYGDRRGALFARLRELAASWRLLCRAPRRCAAALALAAAGQIALSGTALCLARAQHLDVSFVDFLVLMPPVTLLVALPISAGGWGVREGAMVAALAPAGVGASAALLLSMEMGLIAALVSLPGGAIWLLHYVGRPTRLVPAER